MNENYQFVCVPREKIPGQKGALFIQKTSGSTGTPFAVPQDTRKRYRRIGELKYFNHLVGFKSHERLGHCRIWTKWHNKSKWQIFRENIFPIHIEKMDAATAEMLVNTVKEKKLEVLRAYASWYDTMLLYLEAHRDKIQDLRSLKLCLSTSEALNEETKERMFALTKIPIVATYADEEAGMLGQQRIGGSAFYLNHSGYVFEFLKLNSDESAVPGELSRIVITDLFNHAFPLIRYDNGDTAIYHQGNESSGGWEYIEKLYGRKSDLVYNTKGEPIHPMNFARILKNVSGIIQWQFIQKTEKSYCLRLNVNGEHVADSSIRELKNLIGSDADIAVEFVDEIPVLASGKRKSVVCEYIKE